MIFHERYLVACTSSLTFGDMCMLNVEEFVFELTFNIVLSFRIFVDFH
jgi:hypothetical protein